MYKKYLQIFLILFIGSLLITPMVFAQGDINEEVYNIGIGFQDEYPTDEGISNLINDIYRNALIIGAIAAVAVIIYGAIYLTISGASPDKQREGKDIITSAIWGVILLFGAFILLNTINPQLIEIDPPGGEQAPTNTQNLGENQVAGCIEDVPDTEYKMCQQRVKVVGISSVAPTCPSEGVNPNCTPNSAQSGYNINCSKFLPGIGEQPVSETPTCDQGTPACTFRGQAICRSGPDSEPLSNIGACVGLFGIGDCSDKIKTRSETIESGGAYAQALYYPKNGFPSQAKCIVYDYKINEFSDIEKAGLSGLKLCIGSKENTNKNNE